MRDFREMRAHATMHKNNWHMPIYKSIDKLYLYKCVSKPIKPHVAYAIHFIIMELMIIIFLPISFACAKQWVQ